MIFVFYLEGEIIRRHGRRKVHENLEIGSGIAINIRLNDIEIISTPSEMPQLTRCTRKGRIVDKDKAVIACGGDIGINGRQIDQVGAIFKPVYKIAWRA